jgi:EmrB/QacA subfamily drug resistance transporter
MDTDRNEGVTLTMPAKSPGLARPGSTAAIGSAPEATGSAHSHLGLALVVIAAAQLMVVLDATIVNVALPHIQAALGFSGSGLEWVVNAYALTFGGLLLLGGRAGDILGRRRVFIAGIVLFATASLLGGFATSQAWLLGARAIQGVGAAIVAPTALSLITTTFPEGPRRNRAMGVYAAMSIGGAAIGLLLGGVLTSYVSWRWVFFVNVPIAIVVALMAPRVLGESERHTGRFDLPGAITGTGGLAALVYGLSSAATTANGVSHWGDTKVLASLAAAVVLLISFVLIESRSKHPLLPLRLFRDRNRTGANLILLCVGTALFGMFFFLTIFVQTVWGYSPVKTGLAYLPMVGTIMLMAGVSAQLVGRIGARPLLIAGSSLATGGMFWLSRITEHSTYVGGLLGPIIVTAFHRPGHPGHGCLDRRRRHRAELGRRGARGRGKGGRGWPCGQAVRDPACGGQEGHSRPLAGRRVLPWLRGVGRRSAARSDHHAGDDPGDAQGSRRRHAPDDGWLIQGTGLLSASSP